MTMGHTYIWFLKCYLIVLASLVTQLVKNLPAMQETQLDSWVKIPWRRDRGPTPAFLDSLVVQTVKNLPIVIETWVWSLDWEDPLEEVMATHSSVLAWRIPMDRGNGGLQSMGSQRVRHDWVTMHNTTLNSVGIFVCEYVCFCLVIFLLSGLSICVHCFNSCLLFCESLNLILMMGYVLIL